MLFLGTSLAHDTRNMKKNHYIIPFAVLLGTLIAYQWNTQNQDQELVSNPYQASKSDRLSSSSSTANLIDRSLAAKGMLWETVASNGRERSSKAINIAADSFSAVSQHEVGTSFALKLSPHVPTLQASVANRNTHSDGTIVTNLTIQGSSSGQLSIQENASMDFFLAQLYYENHPIAYEFQKSADGITATRHELSEMICSLLDYNAGEVAQMGLPPVDKVRGKKSDDDDAQAIAKAKKLIQEAKPTGGGTTTTLSLRISDATITEGNSGTKNLAFTVTLSKSDRNKTISATYSTANGTATSGLDFTATAGTVTIPARATAATILVPIIGDTTVEANETFTVNLSNPINATISDAQGLGNITNDDSAPSAVPVFNSLPGAVAVAYLDMDGQVVSGTSWAGGATITTGGVVGTLSNAQMIEICNRVAEDYAPFQINVTTEESAYLAAPTNRRIRCIITPDNEWYGANAGGVAYLNSFTWTGDTPCWVFSDMLSNSPRYIAEASSHEIGHTLSLAHDGRISPAEGYYTGHGSGEVGWAPIMGVGYYKLLVQWSKGEYLSANNTENDLSKITSLNGFGYRVDQQGNTTATAAAVTGTSGARSAKGIIETTGDADVFSFSTVGGACSFSASGDATSQNVDVQLEILDASGAVITSDNADLLTDASVSATLSAGTYFLRVTSVGRGDILADGYSNYGSIGQYSISGNAP